MQAANKAESINSAQRKRTFVLVLNILSVFFYIAGVAIIIGSILSSAYMNFNVNATSNATENAPSPYSLYY